MNAHTKQQQDKVFETDFIDSQKSDPPFAHLLALSHVRVFHDLELLRYIYICSSLCNQMTTLISHWDE